MKVAEVGECIRAARLECGLSQAAVASMVGVSRATINYLENGTGDVALSTVLAAADLLGVAPSFSSRRPVSSSAIEWAVQSANTSYRRAMSAEDLRTVLVSGSVPAELIPHVSHVLSELSDRRLVAVLSATAAQEGVPLRTLWRKAEQVAAQVMSPHPRWQHASSR